MAVYYKLTENQIKSSKGKGKWYAKARPIGVKTLEDMAAVIQRNCSMKRSDVLAVLSEFTEVFSGFLQDGFRVKINGLGAFKVGLRSEGAINPAEFKPEKNIKSSHVNFRADAVWSKNARKYITTALEGVTYANITQAASAKEMEKRKEAMSDQTEG